MHPLLDVAAMHNPWRQIYTGVENGIKTERKKTHAPSPGYADMKIGICREHFLQQVHNIHEIRV